MMVLFSAICIHVFMLVKRKFLSVVAKVVRVSMVMNLFYNIRGNGLSSMMMGLNIINSGMR